MLQKKRPVRVAELETQISQLKDDLKNVKDELVSSESWKDQAKQDAEESRKQLLAMSSRLEESQKLLARSFSEKTHVSRLLGQLRMSIYRKIEGKMGEITDFDKGFKSNLVVCKEGL